MVAISLNGPRKYGIKPPWALNVNSCNIVQHTISFPKDFYKHQMNRMENLRYISENLQRYAKIKKKKKNELL